MKNIYWIIAGVINLFTALLHLIAGQMDLVTPLMNNDMPIDHRAQWLRVWHIVTVLLFVTSFYLLKFGLGKYKSGYSTVQMIGVIYILALIPFIYAFISMSTSAIQWILLFPIGILAVYGLKKVKQPSELKSHH